MIVLPITEKIITEANKMLANTKILNNSITKGQGNLAGCLGEIGVREVLNKKYSSEAEIVGHYDYDILAKKKGVKIEVKTKRCTSVPRGNYECSVANFNDRQNCDYYVFTRVSKENIYVLGFLSRMEFLNKSRQMREGVEDNNLVNGKKFKFSANCKNVFIKELRKFK